MLVSGLCKLSPTTTMAMLKKTLTCSRHTIYVYH